MRNKKAIDGIIVDVPKTRASWIIIFTNIILRLGFLMLFGKAKRIKNFPVWGKKMLLQFY